MDSRNFTAEAQSLEEFPCWRPLCLGGVPHQNDEGEQYERLEDDRCGWSIREIESDVFECLPEHYKKRREAVLYFPLLPHHGWHRQASHGGMGSSFLIPTLQDWQRALDQGNIEAAVVYPTRFMHIGQVGMSEFAVDLSRA